MAFNWFFAIGKGSKPVFKKRPKPVPQIIQLLPLQLEGEQIIKSGELSKRQMNELTAAVKKLGIQQDDMAMAVEDLTEGMQDQRDSASGAISEKSAEISALISAMITAADYTEDFYNYAKESGSPEIYEQAAYFWNSLNKKFSAAGLARIYDENTAADAAYNKIIAAEVSETAFKPGIITKTLRSGYIYKGKVIRRSEVVVAKAKENL